MQPGFEADEQSRKRAERDTKCDPDAVCASEGKSGVRRPLKVRIGGWVANLVSWYQY
jgi:hypothetical protein